MLFESKSQREDDHFHRRFTLRSIEVKPTPVKNPTVVACSPDALKLIGVDEDTARVRTEIERIPRIHDVCLISRMKHS